MLLETRINSDEARTILARYPNLSKFMSWANDRSIGLKFVIFKSDAKSKASKRIERVTLEAVHEAAKQAGDGKAIGIKFLDAHGRDTLSPDFVSIVDRDGEVDIKAFAVTGTTKYTFDGLARMSNGYYVNDPTMINLERARRFNITPILIYYDSTGELRLNYCRGKYRKKKIRNKCRRLYDVGSFVPTGTLDAITPIIDDMIISMRRIKFVGIRHLPRTAEVEVNVKCCECGCMWWVNATAALASDIVRISCYRCGCRGIINWQDIIKASELQS